VRRREFITLLGGATTVWPLAAGAQRPTRMRHIGVFLGLAQSADDPGTGEVLRPFQAAMQEAGWVDGNNIRLDYRFGGGDLVRINASAAELVELAPELIYATGLLPVQALRQRTSTIPIVFSLVADLAADANRSYCRRPIRPCNTYRPGSRERRRKAALILGEQATIDTSDAVDETDAKAGWGRSGEQSEPTSLPRLAERP
jgi:hypothetical protein